MASGLFAAGVAAASPYVVKAFRMYMVRYGPETSRKGAKEAKRHAVEAHHSRDFVRLAALGNYVPISEDELREITESDVELSQFSESLQSSLNNESQQSITKTSNLSVAESPPEPRKVRLCYQTIRLSRNVSGTQALSAVPLSFFSHWYVEVDGVSFELRDPRRDFPRNPQNRKQVLHEELGRVDKNIKLQIASNRELRESNRCFEAGTTLYTTQQIIRIASVIFRRFGQGYDLFLDNCQLFSGLLAETIVTEESTEKIRDIIEGKSMLKLSVAASWVATPAYHLMATLHYALPDSANSQDRDAFCKSADRILEAFESFIFHPRVYVGRNPNYKALYKRIACVDS